MRCSKVRTLLAEYVDQTLGIRLEECVREHLNACCECADLAKGMRHTVSLLRAMPRLETSPDFAHNLRRHLPVAVALSHRQPAHAGLLARLADRIPRSPGRRLGLVAIPLGAALGLALYVWSPGPPPAVVTVPDQPVISEKNYLVGVAQEHAGYAGEHPLLDTSATNLSIVVASAPTNR